MPSVASKLRVGSLERIRHWVRAAEAAGNSKAVAAVEEAAEVRQLRTVEHLMGELGLAGAHRGGRKRTTIPDPQAPRASNLLQRDFDPLSANLLWVADFTSVSTQAR